MGLDQYAFAVTPRAAHLATLDRELTSEEEDTLDSNKVQLAYWRKHADLNAWMTDLWLRKGGIGDFNCETMPLVLDDLLSLERHIQAHNGYAIRGEGFFWGVTEPEDIEKDKVFIKAAINAIHEGYEVFYYCWY